MSWWIGPTAAIAGVSRTRCSASDSEAVHRWSGTVAKAVCVTVPGLQRIIPLRSMLRSARDTRLS